MTDATQFRPTEGQRLHMSNAEKIARAQDALQLMQTPMLRDSLLALRDEWTKEMVNTELDDDKGRRIARMKLHALSTFAAALRRHMETGKMLEMGKDQEAEMDLFLAEYGL